MIINGSQPFDRASPARTIIKGSQVTEARRSSDRKKYTFEEIIQMVEDKIQVFKMFSVKFLIHVKIEAFSFIITLNSKCRNLMLTKDSVG